MSNYWKDSEYGIGKYVEQMVVAQFQVLSWNMPGGTETYKKLRQEYQCPGWDSNQ
jgi:hypothetical protein